jgi:hypothetical protein
VVDLESGLELLRVDAPNLVDYIDAARDLPPGLSPELTAPLGLGWAAGPGAAWSSLNLDVAWSSFPRLFLYDDESGGRWGVADPACGPSNAGRLTTLFNTELEVWTAWAVGVDVFWARTAHTE